MQPSLDLRRLLLSLMTVAVLSCCVFGQAPPPSEVSDQKAGSILFYPFYSSSSTDPAADSRIAATNTMTNRKWKMTNGKCLPLDLDLVPSRDGFAK